MATYPNLSATLSALYSTKDDPQGAAAATELSPALRQTRNWLYDFLSTYIDPGTNKIRSSAFASAGSSLPPGIVRGTNPVGNTQREIVQASILGVDIGPSTISAQNLQDNCITNSKVLDGQIQGTKLALGTITTDRLASGAFTGANIADKTIDGSKIIDASLTGVKLSTLTVQSGNMAGRSIQGPSLPIATEGQILVGGNGVGKDEFAAVSLTGAIGVDKTGNCVLKRTLSGGTVSFARVVERTSSGVSAGISTANTWHYRGVSPAPPWTLVDFTRDFIEVAPPKILFKEGGKYLVSVISPMYGNVSHKAALIYVPDPGDLSTVRFYEGSSVDGASAMNSYSFIECVLDVPDPTQPSSESYFIVRHWTLLGSGGVNTGLGHAVSAIPDPLITGSSPPLELYCQVSILKVQETIN